MGKNIDQANEIRPHIALRDINIFKKNVGLNPLKNEYDFSTFLNEDTEGPEITILVIKAKDGKLKYLIDQEELNQKGIVISDQVKEKGGLTILNESLKPEVTKLLSSELVLDNRNIFGRTKDYIASTAYYQYAVENPVNSVVTAVKIVAGLVVMGIGLFTLAPMIAAFIVAGPVAVVGASAVIGTIGGGAIAAYKAFEVYDEKVTKFKKDNPERFPEEQSKQKSTTQIVKEQVKEIMKLVQPETPTLKTEVAKEANNIATKAHIHISFQPIETSKRDSSKPSPALTTPNQEQKGNHHNKAARKF